LLIGLILIISFSCDDGPTGIVGGGSIVGDWLESTAVVNLALTTNSNQQTTNLLNNVGEIVLNGDYNAKLKLMIYFEGDEEEEPGLAIMNSFLGVGADTSYAIALDPTEADKNGELLVEVNDDSEFEDELTNIID